MVPYHWFKVKLDDMEGKVYKSLEDVQTRLSNQIKELEFKLQGFDIAD